MALTTVPVENTLTAASKDLRRKAKHSILTLEQNLLDIAALATANTKASLSTELGADAADFAKFYDNSRALVLLFKPESKVPTRASLP